VVEMKVSGDPDRADAASARLILFLKQPYANHNGGDVVFGPDGKLYVGTGDGGSARDPHGNGQNPAALLGKMLRLDVDAAAPRPEIVAIGLRNPWRYAFDGDVLYIADVGQDRYEEIDVVPLAALAGANFGWNVLEGRHCLEGASCDDKGMIAPVVEYDHRSGCSVTGGQVYRGKALPQLAGIYFFSDYCTGLVRGFRWRDGAVADYWDWKPALDPAHRLAAVSSFGVDADGELYILSLDGIVWKLVPGPGPG
jgi:glucose/arabinose dehydrogenase